MAVEVLGGKELCGPLDPTYEEQRTQQANAEYSASAHWTGLVPTTALTACFI